MAYIVGLFVLKFTFLCTTAIASNINNKEISSQLLQCELIEGTVIFRFPRLRQNWESDEDENQIELRYNGSIKSVSPLREARSSQKGDYLYAVTKEQKGSTKLNFRLLLKRTDEGGGKRNQTIEDFHYNSNVARVVRPWANDWSYNDNVDCFNFTTPYMVKIDCDYLELMYCVRELMYFARKQFTIPWIPRFKINNQDYMLNDEEWKSKHCIQMDRECNKCRVLLRNIETEKKSYNVCLTNTATHSNQPFECQVFTTQCAKPIKDRFTSLLIWSSTGMALLLFSLLLVSSYAAWLKKHRTTIPANDTPLLDTSQESMYVEIGHKVVEFNGKKYAELGEMDSSKHQKPPAPVKHDDDKDVKIEPRRAEETFVRES